MSILIVDDVSLMRRILKNILVGHCGIDERDIYEATDGNVALREYKRFKPRVVFLDVLMPIQDGKETVRELMAEDPNAYIIMCSSAGEREIVRDCVNNGAKDYIIKPLDPERVKLALENSGFLSG
ncbi:MAG: response regulator [Defluviitaleaceae bacterium]|nr:response regulator [Defluviitaleaceae bacterium]